ncbi:hypothetical protein [Aurantiacibacter sp. MUD61]|uniref:hypothetical protein n=1 Tax=Aurantiacibacter sp. MUD61 TaxID=3009083 RepID=UPI0022F12861|nr:hypothetical protein [Aurantiacibacter sp. MUD61]
MHKGLFVPLGVVAALALTACGESGASASDETGESMADALAVADGQTLTEQPAVTIPAEFHGTWGFMGDCANPIVITATEVGEGDDQPPLSKMEILDDGVVEFDRVSNPEFPEADYRFGLTVAGPDMLMMSSPGSSSLRMERCAEAPAEPLQEVAQEGGGLPRSFHGEWDMTYGYEEGGEACTGNSGNAFTIEARRLVYPFGTARLSDITRVNDREYRMSALFVSDEGVEGTPTVTTYTLSSDGQQLTESFEDGEPFVYIRC